MSRVLKRVCLALVVMLVMSSVAAADSVFIGDGDIGGIRMYDSQGVALEATVEVASNIGEGWILHNPDSPILIITPKGSINLYEDSILITGDLISNDPSLYLVKGKATFSTYDMEGGSLSISTPVSLFTLKGDGEIFVITDDIEESATVFKGVGTSYNSITGVTRTISAFQKLGMHESLAKAKPIASGYYLTYATYPDLMLAKQLLSEMATEQVDTPKVPKFSSVLRKPLKEEPPVLQTGVIIMPSKAPSFAQVNVTESATPSKPYSITVTREHLNVPSIPQSLTSTIIARPKSRIVVTVRPMAPSIPSLVQSVTEPVAVARPATPAVPTVAQVVATTAAKATVTTEIPLKQDKPQSVLFTQEKDIKAGSVGIQASYSFLFDGTDSNKMLHTLTVKPYVTYKSFALTLQSSVSTEDFSLFTSNTSPVPAGTLEMLSYGFSFISSARIGYTSSPFFLALDNKAYHGDLTDHFFAPSFGESSKLSLFNRIAIGSFSSNIYFDNLYLTDILASKSQFASFALEYAKQEGYRFSASLGTLAKIENTPIQRVNLYPNLNFLFPLVDVRTTQLSLLISASGYLPAYPNFDTSQFIDTSLISFFPNYQVSSGLSLKQGAFSAKLLGSLRKGENRNLLNSELLAFTTSSTSYNSVFDLFAEVGFAGEHFSADFAVNLPFTSDFTLADGSGSHKADFNQLSLSYQQKAFTFSFGRQQVGIGKIVTGIIDGNKDFISLLGGDRSTSFLSISYTTGGLTVKAKASYPADPSVYTTPKITITASYKVGAQF